MTKAEAVRALSEAHDQAVVDCDLTAACAYEIAIDTVEQITTDDKYEKLWNELKRIVQNMSVWDLMVDMEADAE